MRIFEYEGGEWSVVESGAGIGIGGHYPPPITPWGVWFFRVSEPGEKVAGRIHSQSVGELSNDQLIRALRNALDRGTESSGLKPPPA